MIITDQDLNDADAFFNSASIDKLQPLAGEMNRKHSVLPNLLKELERSGIDGHIIDELMQSIITTWYVIEKVKFKRIAIISDIDIKTNLELFISFIRYYNGSDEEEPHLDYIVHEKAILRYATKILGKLYPRNIKVPNEVISLYFSIMKCFEDKLAYTRKEAK